MCESMNIRQDCHCVNPHYAYPVKVMQDEQILRNVPPVCSTIGKQMHIEYI
jgi:hypothetical protein